MKQGQARSWRTVVPLNVCLCGGIEVDLDFLRDDIPFRIHVEAKSLSHLFSELQWDHGDCIGLNGVVHANITAFRLVVITPFVDRHHSVDRVQLPRLRHSTGPESSDVSEQRPADVLQPNIIQRDIVIHLHRDGHITGDMLFDAKFPTTFPITTALGEINSIHRFPVSSMFSTCGRPRYALKWRKRVSNRATSVELRTLSKQTWSHCSRRPERFFSIPPDYCIDSEGYSLHGWCRMGEVPATCTWRSLAPSCTRRSRLYLPVHIEEHHAGIRLRGESTRADAVAAEKVIRFYIHLWCEWSKDTHGQSSRELDKRKYMELFTCWARSRDREKVVITVSLSPLPSVSKITLGETNGCSSAGWISMPDSQRRCHASTCSSKRLFRLVRASSKRLIASRVTASGSIGSGPKSILLASVEINWTVEESSIVCVDASGCWVQIVT